MSRLGPADTVTVKPTNNVYTVLVFVAFLAIAAALYAMNQRAELIYGAGLMK